MEIAHTKSKLFCAHSSCNFLVACKVINTHYMLHCLGDMKKDKLKKV
jgi:hypothetical protein